MVLTRRGLLSGAGALALLPLLNACADDAPTTIGPDQAALDAAAATERALLAQATAIQSGSAAALARIEAAADAHRAHIDALVSAGASSTSGQVELPTTPAARIPLALARAQDRQADALQALALGTSPRIAQLLGSIAASDAAHALLIRSTS
jgi:hypothetical protein